MSRGRRHRKSQVICVAGMHRSGTSMVARLLNLCGVYLGAESEMLPANYANEAGYWENTRFVDLNDEILSRLGTGWDLPVLPPEGWERLPEMIPLRARAGTLIQGFSTHPRWGWKDPRNSITLPFWRLLAPNLKVVICVRNPLEVMRSLASRGASSQAFGLNLWSVYNQRLLAQTSPHERVVTHYESYFHNPGAELERLVQALDIPASNELIERACQSVLASARHNVVGAEDILSSEIPPDVFQCYMDLCAEAGPVYLQQLDKHTRAKHSSEGVLDPHRQRYEDAFLGLRYEKMLIEKEATIKDLQAELATREKALEDLRGVDSGHAGSAAANLLGCREGIAQLFLPTSSGHKEEASCREKVVPGQWVKLAFPVNMMDRDAPVPLRFDPIDHVGVVEIAGLELISEVDGSTIWRADNKADFEQLEVSGPAVRLPASRVLRFFSYGNDPQVYLPMIAGLGSLGPVRFEVWLRFEPDFKYLADGLKRFTSQLHESTAALQSALKRNEEREAELKSHAELLGAAQRRLADLEDLGSKRNREIKHLQALLTERELDLARAHDALAHLGQELDQCELRVAGVQESLDHRDAQLTGMVNSICWRVTAPLRRLGWLRSTPLWPLMKWTYWTCSLQLPYRLRQRRDIRLIKGSGLFDVDFYLDRYHDAAASGADPVYHFLECPISERRNPNPFFDTGYYLDQYPDVAASGLNPLIHYLQTGAAQGYNPSPRFDTRHYLGQNPEVARSGVNPLRHYLQTGEKEGCSPSISRKVPSNEIEILQALKPFLPNDYSGGARGTRDALEKHGYAALNEIMSSQRSLEFCATDAPVVSIVIPVFNKAHYTVNCLMSILLDTQSQPYEIIVVDDNSSDSTREFLNRLKNINVFRNEQQQGFIYSCNFGAKHARGEFICFLNNDTIVTMGSLNHLIDTINTSDECGAVGAKLVFPDGTLQEAGSILWSDGSALGYGRDDDPFKPEYCFPREVAYCSAACLLVRKKLFDQIGGFDPLYKPAYYEDTDLCMKIKERGLKVLYQPRAMVVHLEYSSSSSDDAKTMMIRNQAVFHERWDKYLSAYPSSSSDNVLLARDERRSMRVLVLDDRVPGANMGSGYPRSYEMIRLLAESGYLVSVFPLQDQTAYQPWCDTLQRMGVEVFYAPYADICTFLRSRKDYYDVAIISRPHNAAQYLPTVKTAWPATAIVYDAEAIFGVRDLLLAEDLGNPLSQNQIDTLVTDELRPAKDADVVITVSRKEQALVTHYLPQSECRVWGHPVTPVQPERKAADRKGLLFVGAFPIPNSPNEKSITYFVREIWPHISSVLDCSLTIVGGNPPESVRNLANDKIVVAGFIEDLKHLYENSRLFVVPHRYAAGIPLKALEAMSFGLPCVLSSIIAEQLDITDGDGALVGRDELDFAAKIIDLYTDEHIWNRVQKSAFRYLHANFDRSVLKVSIQDILRQAVDKRQTAGLP
jgi:GT2 family glycosyltransferase/glycosyltransferase involved in cell wall biosynthesis